MADERMTDEGYKIDDWELYNIPDENIEKGQPSKFKYFTAPGLYTVKIVDAKYYDEYTAPKKTMIDTYSLTIECIEEGVNAGARAKLTYFVKNEERTKFNDNTLGTLRSLGKALFSDVFTGYVPAPGNIIGGVVVADVKISKPDALERTFPKVYHWQSASSDFAIFSDIKQYFREVKAIQ